VWLGPGAVLSPGEICFAPDGRIAAVRRARGGKIAPWLVLPGLVNAHVHLQLPALPDAPLAFVAWVRAVIAWYRQPDAMAQARARTVASVDELRRSGCTAVGEIDALGTSPALLRAAGMAGRCYQEVVGFCADAAAAGAILRARHVAGSAACPGGISPHAPYSCSAALVRQAARSGSFLAIHAAEIAAEGELLRTGQGPLRQLLQDLGKWPRGYRPPARSPVAWLAACGALSPRSLLVHLQEADDDDLELVRRHRAKVAVCPATIAFFRRRPPPVERWLARGLCVGLGTDSRASAQSPLSMLDAMARARRLWPGLSPEQVLGMATAQAAAAIGRPSLGRLAMACRGDMCAFELGRRMSLSDALEATTCAALGVTGVWLRGSPLPQAVRAPARTMA
jgi:cytosine/adenosine deaminase-related metal-dependent hydrolase